MNVLMMMKLSTFLKLIKENFFVSLKIPPNKVHTDEKIKLGDCPTKFLTSKRKISRLIDTNMSEYKNITQIKKGLPYDLRQALTIQGVDNVNALLEKLRSLSEIYDEHQNSRPLIKNSVCLPARIYPSTSTNFRGNSSRNNYSRGASNSNAHNQSQSAPMPTFLDQVSPLYPKGKNQYTPSKGKASDGKRGQANL